MSHPSPEGPFWLEPEGPPLFPPTEYACRDPDGLLGVGGALSPSWLLAAYRRGIFPWYSDDQPILWWSPEPRAVLFPDKLKVSRSLGKSLRNRGYTATLDTAFEQVIDACAAPRQEELAEGEAGTWITEEMRAAYCEMHRLGHAHSVEVWHEGELVGGLYGIAIGRVFFGESMFSRQRDASKVALVRLVEWLKAHGFGLIDCQQATGHLMSLGAETLPRPRFEALLDEYGDEPTLPGPWDIEGDTP